MKRNYKKIYCNKKQPSFKIVSPVQKTEVDALPSRRLIGYSKIGSRPKIPNLKEWTPPSMLERTQYNKRIRVVIVQQESSCLPNTYNQ